MAVSVREIEEWMNEAERERLEFKEAKNSFDIARLVDYCIALANEGGGRLILGVSDRKPRKVVGTSAFGQISSLKSRLLDQVGLRIDIDEVQHPAGRVLAFHVPPRPVGTPLHREGRYLMRSGDSLVAMSQDQLRRIFAEVENDFSATLVHEARLVDLDLSAIERLQGAWLNKSKNPNLAKLSAEHLLSDAGLLCEGRVTIAALILLGKSAAITRWLSQAEVIFEWRDRENAVSFQDRREFRAAAFSFLEELWSLINLRNTRQQYRDGLFAREIPTFNQEAVREAILNAISHRDYRATGSVFVRQSPTTLEVESPGPLPPGVNPENIVFKQVPRNRLLAEVLSKCGLVERSGQGVDRMFETAIREGKQPPDFSRTDAFHVSVILPGTVQDLRLLRFLERASGTGGFSFATADLIVLDRVYRELPVPETFRSRAAELMDHGLVERVGRGRGARYILSPKFYEFAGISGAYTRKRGLDRQTNKELLARHIEQRGNRGSTFSELAQVLPSLSRAQIKSLLSELKVEGRVHAEGVTRNAMWFPGSVPSKKRETKSSISQS